VSSGQRPVASEEGSFGKRRAGGGRFNVESRPVRQAQGRQFKVRKEKRAEAHHGGAEEAEIRRKGSFALRKVKKSMIHNL